MSSTPREPGVNGGLILALSILGLLLCGPLTIISWIMANAALRTLDYHPGSSQRGLVQAGQIISIVGIVLWVLFAWTRLSNLPSQRSYMPTTYIGGKPVESVGGRVYVNGKPADPSTPEGSLALHLQTQPGKK
ncbi:hypothetical protein [Armatimonas sp.]|uniref:hypothetical protein n=1 Tax=Armatimonas sp. TaxID=1872638 RepID=UPI00286CBA20|nr:hypothetical protein [Armatimonas sp.]